MGAESVGVGGTGYGCFQKAVVPLDSGEYVDKEGDELEITHRVFSRGEKHCAGISAEGPVVVLSRAVHPCEGLLME